MADSFLLCSRTGCRIRFDYRALNTQVKPGTCDMQMEYDLLQVPRTRRKTPATYTANVYCNTYHQRNGLRRFPQRNTTDRGTQFDPTVTATYTCSNSRTDTML